MLCPMFPLQTHESPDYENSSAAAQLKAADDILYASVTFIKNPEAVYSNIRTTLPSAEERKEEEVDGKDGDEEEEGVEYSTINIRSATASPRWIFCFLAYLQHYYFI